MAASGKRTKMLLAAKFISPKVVSAFAALTYVEVKNRAVGKRGSSDDVTVCWHVAPNLDLQSSRDFGRYAAELKASVTAFPGPALVSERHFPKIVRAARRGFLTEMQTEDAVRVWGTRRCSSAILAIIQK